MTANSNGTFLKMVHSKAMKINACSFLLKDVVNSIEVIPTTAFTAGDSKLCIKLFTLITEHILWALLSNGILYEYDFSMECSRVIENSGTIQYYRLL